MSKHVHSSHLLIGKVEYLETLKSQFNRQVHSSVNQSTQLWQTLKKFPNSEAI